MRILIATSHRTVVGGVETYVQAVLPALLHRGHQVALLHEQPAVADRETVDHETVGLPAWCLGDEDPARVVRAITDWRPDVAYVQGLKSPAAEEALLENVPAALFAHNYYGTCLSGTKRYAAPTLRCCNRTLGPACLLLYYPRRCGGLSPGTMLTQYRQQRRRQALLPRYRAVLVASRHMHAEYLRHGVPEERLHLVQLFPSWQGRVPTVPRQRPQPSRVLMIGRLTALKGGCYLIEALRQASAVLKRSLSLVVAGDGPERAALEALAKRRGVPTEFVGWVDAARRTELMSEADLLAVPSLWPEPFGLVGLEAACLGLPAVAYAVGGIPDWLVPGESGELAGATLTVAGLAEALVRALADPAHLCQLRLGARRMAQRFTREQHIAELDTILRRVALSQ